MRRDAGELEGLGYRQGRGWAGVGVGVGNRAMARVGGMSEVVQPPPPNLLLSYKNKNKMSAVSPPSNNPKFGMEQVSTGDVVTEK